MTENDAEREPADFEAITRDLHQRAPRRFVVTITTIDPEPPPTLSTTRFSIVTLFDEHKAVLMAARQLQQLGLSDYPWRVAVEDLGVLDRAVYDLWGEDYVYNPDDIMDPLEW
jgi:hypothetical protein